MIITDIIKKTNGKQYNIYIDEELKLTIDLSLILELNIKKDMIVDEHWLEDIKSKIEFDKAYRYSIRLLTIGDKTSEELRRKLRNKKYGEPVIDLVIDKLSGYGYIDDLIYVERWINEKSKVPGNSKKSIYYKLLKKGISKELLDEKVNNMEIDEFGLALLAAEKKLKSLHGDENKVKRKLLYFLSRKGYSSNICYKVADKLLGTDEWD